MQHSKFKEMFQSCNGKIKSSKLYTNKKGYLYILNGYLFSNSKH